MESLEKKVKVDPGGSQPARVERRTLHFISTFRKRYVRTKEGNLRCWPQCDTVHMEKSFCGSPLEIGVWGNENWSSAFLFGEFRTTSRNASFRIGDKIDKDLLEDSQRFIFSKYVREHDGTQKFVVSPSRKWKCREEKRLNSTSRFHTFTIYLTFNDEVHETLDSQPFQVVTSKAKLEPVKRDPALVAKLEAIAKSGGGPVKGGIQSFQNSRDDDEEDGYEDSEEQMDDVQSVPHSLVHPNLGMQQAMLNMLHSQSSRLHPNALTPWVNSINHQFPNQPQLAATSTFYYPHMASNGVIPGMPPLSGNDNLNRPDSNYGSSFTSWNSNPNIMPVMNPGMANANPLNLMTQGPLAGSITGASMPPALRQNLSTSTPSAVPIAMSHENPRQQTPEGPPQPVREPSPSSGSGSSSQHSSTKI